MSDWWYNYGHYVVFGIMGLFMVLAVLAFIASGFRYSRLMNDCIRDGHQEYECVGILSDRR